MSDPPAAHEEWVEAFVLAHQVIEAPTKQLRDALERLTRTKEKETYMKSEKATSDVRVTALGTKVVLEPWTPAECKNRCELNDENTLQPDGYCDACHEYPRG